MWRFRYAKFKSNIDHYMELKGIRMYSHLLVDIAHELGLKDKKHINLQIEKSPTSQKC